MDNEDERAKAEGTLKDQTAPYADLLTRVQKKLDTYVMEVRLSNRLTTSPVCLVGAEHDYSPQMERFLRPGNTDANGGSWS